MSSTPTPAPRFTLAGHTIVQARFPRTNADVIINTFVFDRGVGDDANIVNRLNTFYFGLNSVGGQVQPLALIMSKSLQTPTYYMRDADQAVGTPGRELAGTGTFPGTRGDLPNDLAICASYRAALPNGPRRRGRLYIGPLHGVIPGGSAALFDTLGRIHSGAKDIVNQAAQGLATVSPSNPVRWVIASRVGNTSAPITRGYVDSHFDTMRSRDPGTEFFGRANDAWIAG